MLVGIGLLTVVALCCYTFIAVVSAFKPELAGARRGIVAVWILGTLASAYTHGVFPL